MSLFSANEATSLEKQLENGATIKQTASEDLGRVYEIQKCLNWITKNKFKKVCLQFPDHLLPDSTEIALILQRMIGEAVYVMADTAYGSCCIDYVTAQHVNGDAIIHFGPVCFSEATETIPTLKIYEKWPLDLEALEKAYDFSSQIVLLLFDTPYIHLMEDASRRFEKYGNAILRPIDGDLSDLDEHLVIFVGGNMRKLLNVKLSHRPRELFYYNLQEVVEYELDSRVLKRRNYLIEKIRDSNVIGVVIATVAVKNYFKVIDRVKKLISLYGKKYYVINVGKPTVAKLANFPELEVYVVISCSMNEIYENRDYYKPIVTPYDVEMALNSRANPQFTYDYNHYLQDDNLAHIQIDQQRNDNLSLLAGRLRVFDGVPPNQIATRAFSSVEVSGVGYLQARTWRGLEQNLGEDEPQLAGEGRRGVAQNYQNEL